MCNKNLAKQLAGSQTNFCALREANPNPDIHEI